MSDDRKKILHDVIHALEESEDLIRVENEADVCVAQQIGIPKFMISQLTLKPGKVS